MANEGGRDSSSPAEYLSNLQAQIDRLTERNESLEKRVAKLLEDRARLRSRLAKRRRWRRRTSGEEADRPPEEPDRSIDVPGVGMIPDAALALPPPRRTDLVVATILDPFSRAAYAPEFECIDVAPGGVDALEASSPSMLFVESAYQGVDGRWASRIARFGRPHPALVTIVDWCRERGLPTVFWNKEDPINYDWFISSACLFDHVFTVDANSVPRYRADLGHDRIHVLPFAAQPAIHHPPADEAIRTGSVAFAGSYYAAKHPERQRQMHMLLDPARDLGLHIFDRFAGSNDERFAWPDRFLPHIIGRLTYPQTLEAYRRYRVFLNVNTVTDSPTMCARRIFELLASGAAVVSGPSQAITETVDPGVVATVASVDEARSAINELLLDEPERRHRAEAGLRWITQSHHTLSDRVDSILRVLP